MTSTLPFGQRAKELLQELKRSEWLPAFNDDLVRQIIEEVNALYKQIRDAVATQGEPSDPAVACPLMVFHTSAIRNKRCLLAYLQFRTEKLVELRWQAGSAPPAEFDRKLSADERQYFEGYDGILGAYMRSMDLDLTADQQPPKKLFIEVRVLQDCGEILTESGPVRLERNTTHFLRRADVEHLIRQGALEQIAA